MLRFCPSIWTLNSGKIFCIPLGHFWYSIRDKADFHLTTRDVFRRSAICYENNHPLLLKFLFYFLFGENELPLQWMKQAYKFILWVRLYDALILKFENIHPSTKLQHILYLAVTVIKLLYILNECFLYSFIPRRDAVKKI